MFVKIVKYFCLFAPSVAFSIVIVCLTVIEVNSISPVFGGIILWIIPLVAFIPWLCIVISTIENCRLYFKKENALIEKIKLNTFTGISIFVVYWAVWCLIIVLSWRHLLGMLIYIIPMNLFYVLASYVFIKIVYKETENAKLDKNLKKELK